MKSILYTLLIMCISWVLGAQQNIPVSFTHVDRTVNGTLFLPAGDGPFTTLIIAPGSGANDRNGTIPVLGPNAACLYPDLLGQTLRPYKDLGEALVDSGYAVLRYDKLEFTYQTPSALGPITFEKLWLPVHSAIDFLKTRPEVDPENIILLGHSEGSTLIPHIARERDDVRALISVAGAHTPFDSILAYQLVFFAEECNGNVAQAQSDANQILLYFNLVRNQSWNAGTPPLFGVSPAVWYDYTQATDPVAENYNLCELPTLFIGLELDLNVPPSELALFESSVHITEDFWLISGLNHYMTPNDDPEVPEMLSDTIVHWLRQLELTSSVQAQAMDGLAWEVFPNPSDGQFQIRLQKPSASASLRLTDWGGRLIREEVFQGMAHELHIQDLPTGLYYLSLHNGERVETQKLVKR
jgi:pimeloyl-ACP methyl ester carboxylesterase